jgi:hypothetical protein
MITPAQISGDSLRAIIAIMRTRAPDMIPRLEILLKRDPVQERTDSSPEMFAVDVEARFAIMLGDILATVVDDPIGPSVFRGQKASDLAEQWRHCISQL